MEYVQWKRFQDSLILTLSCGNHSYAHLQQKRPSGTKETQNIQLEKEKKKKRILKFNVRAKASVESGKKNTKDLIWSEKHTGLRL